MKEKEDKNYAIETENNIVYKWIMERPGVKWTLVGFFVICMGLALYQTKRDVNSALVQISTR